MPDPNRKLREETEPVATGRAPAPGISDARCVEGRDAGRRAAGAGAPAILIIDPDAMARRGTAAMLSDRFDTPEITEADSLYDAASILQLGNVDLVILGLEAGGEFFALPRGELSPLAGAAKTLVYVRSCSNATALRIIAAGMKGLVFKSSNARVLLSAADLVLSGEIYLPGRLFPVFHDVMLSLPSGLSIGGHASLTARQRDVLELISRGYSNKEIARDLAMLEGTVKVHVKSIFRKLGVKNRTQAAIAGLGARMEGLG